MIQVHEVTDDQVQVQVVDTVEVDEAVDEDEVGKIGKRSYQ